MDLALMCRPCDSQSDINAEQRVSGLLDQNQALKRQLRYAQQQQASFAEASMRARGRSQHLAAAVVAAEEEAKSSAAETAHVQAQLEAQAVMAEQEAARIAALSTKVLCLQDQLQQSSAAQSQAQRESDINQESVQAAQKALKRYTAIIRTLQHSIETERSAACVRAASVRIRAVMQASLAANDQAGCLKAQIARLLAEQQALKQQLEQKLQEHVASDLQQSATTARSADPSKSDVGSQPGASRSADTSGVEPATDELGQMSEQGWDAAVASVQLPLDFTLPRLQKVRCCSNHTKRFSWPGAMCGSHQ